jgi:hypothetical protein
MRFMHDPDLLADFVTRLLSTLADKFERARIWSPRMVVLALIVAAIESEIDTVLVLSGVTAVADIALYPYRPRYVLSGVAEVLSA